MKFVKLVVLVAVLAGLAIGTWFYYAPVFIPDEVIEAFDRPEKVALYSLEPDARTNKREGNFHGFKILGKVKLDGDNARTVINAFQKSIVHGTAALPRIEPRHGLQILSNDHLFDFLLCYSCGELDVYEDGTMIHSYKAAGSPDTLNTMLGRVRIPLAKGADIKTKPEAAE